MAISEKLKSGHLADFWRFAVIGALSTVIDIGALNALNYLGFNSYVAVFFGYFLGAVNGYFFNNNWTYKHLGKKANAKAFSQYVLISFIGLGLTELIIYFLTKIIHSSLSRSELLNIYKLIAVVIVFFWNFFANRIITFRKSEND